jgi:hypothetical protein
MMVNIVYVASVANARMPFSIELKFVSIQQNPGF